MPDTFLNLQKFVTLSKKLGREEGIREGKDLLKLTSDLAVASKSYCKGIMTMLLFFGKDTHTHTHRAT